MTLMRAPRRTLSLLVALLLSASAAGFAGCLGDQEEAGGNGDNLTDGNDTNGNGTDGGDNQTGDVGPVPWEENFEVPNGSEELTMDLVVNRIGGDANDWTFELIDPDGNVVFTHNGTWQEGNDTASLTLTAGPGLADGNATGDASADPGAANVTANVELTGGVWEFRVVSDARILVSSLITTTGGEEAEEAA